MPGSNHGLLEIMTSDLSNPIIYCVGPNGTGKTRYLRRTAETEQALFVPKLRQEGGLPTEFNDSQEFTRFLVLGTTRTATRAAPEALVTSPGTAGLLSTFRPVGGPCKAILPSPLSTE